MTGILTPEQRKAVRALISDRVRERELEADSRRRHKAPRITGRCCLCGSPSNGPYCYAHRWAAT